MANDSATSVTLGEGKLTWSRYERIGDRYGAVWLLADGDSLSASYVPAPLDTSLAGQRGSLTAHVLATRQSTHIGDLFRGFFPVTPEVGEDIRLGEGTLFAEMTDSSAAAVMAVGLRPADGREVDWLDPVALYRAHEQTVRLVFGPMQRPRGNGGWRF